MNESNEQLTSSEVAPDDSEQLQTAHADAPAGDKVWDALRNLNREVMAYNVTPALLIPHLRNQELIAKVKNPQELLQNAGLLSKDVAEYRERLSALLAKHDDRNGSSVDADDQLAAIQIHEEYVQFAMSYEQVVIPTVCSMMETLLDAGAELDVDRLNRRPSEIVDGAPVEIDVNIDAGSLEEECHV